MAEYFALKADFLYAVKFLVIIIIRMAIYIYCMKYDESCQFFGLFCYVNKCGMHVFLVMRAVRRPGRSVDAGNSVDPASQLSASHCSQLCQHADA